MTPIKYLIILFCLCVSSLSAVQVFIDQPRDFQPAIECAGVFIECQGEFLFLLTGPGKSHTGKWGIPGGKMEKGEASGQAAVREVLEETGLNLSGCTSFVKTVYIKDKVDFVWHMYEAKLQGKPSIQISSEHSTYRWLTLEEALALPLIPGEAECIELVYG